MSISNTDKNIELPKSLVTECMDYLNGKLVSNELMAQIKNLKEQDPQLSKTEIIESILDYHERKMRAQKEKNYKT
jgi:hypothetical protein